MKCYEARQACLSANKHWQSSFLHCGGFVKLVEACLCVGNTLQSRFKPGGSAVKYVQACLSSSKNRVSSFHHCGGPVKLVQPSIWAGNIPQRRITRRGVLWNTCMCQCRSRKQLSPLWKFCASGASLFMRGGHPTTPFSQLRRCCEARAGLFKFKKVWRKQFSALCRSCEARTNVLMCGKHPTKPF